MLSEFRLIQAKLTLIKSLLNFYSTLTQ
jgi:hypothetical protein